MWASRACWRDAGTDDDGSDWDDRWLIRDSENCACQWTAVSLRSAAWVSEQCTVLALTGDSRLAKKVWSSPVGDASWSGLDPWAPIFAATAGDSTSLSKREQ
jgi:hypothetical protein